MNAPDTQFAIHPDVAQASTPPAWLYRPGPIQARIRERVLGGWQWLADEHDVPTPTGVLPTTLLPGSLAEPLLVTRSSEGLRCISNACTHRGHLVCSAPARGSQLRCPYHGRRFGLDGAFQSAPGFEGAASFPAPEDDLAQLPLAQWGPWLFTALGTPGGGGVDFETWIGPVRRRVGFLPFERAVRRPERSRRWTVDGHFALYVENYLEGLHIPFLHPGLVRTLDFGSYGHELLPLGTLQIAEAAEGELAFEGPLPEGHPESGRSIAAWYFWLFPNFMLNVYPWGVSLNRVRPLGDNRTAIDFESYVFAPELLGRGAGGDLDAVEREDERAVESVQRGLRASLWRRGRYAPEHEVGTHHFHRLLAQHLFPESS